MAATLLGYLPGEWRVLGRSNSRLSGAEDDGVSTRPSPTSGNAGGIHHSGDLRVVVASDTSLSDGDYFDAPTSPQISPSSVFSNVDSARNSRFEPLPTDTADMGDTDWCTFPPPSELLTVPLGTSMEIESLIEASIERLQESLVKQESLRENAAFQRARGGGKGKEPIVMFDDQNQRSFESQASINRAAACPSNVDGTLDLSGQRNSRVSNASYGTSSSRDSGYASGMSDRPSPTTRIGRLLSFNTTLRLSRNKHKTDKQAWRQSQLTTMKGECVSCLDDFKKDELVSLSCHSYCNACFQALIDTALTSETHWPPKCCLNEIPTETLSRHLSTKTKKKYKQVLEERSVPAGDRIYCSKPSCGAWIPPRNINKAILCAVCPCCRQKSCISCRAVYHATGECPKDPSLQATLQLANDEGWRRCYSCNAVVEHNQGCIHMTCKCKAQFCYICGLRWRTCPCSDSQLDAVQQAANERRLATQVREREAEARERATARAAEEQEAELQEILLQIQMYEIEEAYQLAQKEEELRRAAESREAQRVLTLSKKYFELKNELEMVHALQKVAMVERCEKELEKMRRDEEMREVMGLRHATELQLADVISQARISDSEFKFDQDYQARIRKEREIEDRYFAELQAYWANRPDGEVKIREAKDALRDSNAEAYREWDALRRAEHKQVVDVAKEEANRVRCKHDVEISTMAAGASRSTETELQRERLANDKWLDAVAAVRVEMLQAMEEDEYALEED